MCSHRSPHSAKGDSVASLVLLGLAAGIGWWSSPEIVYFLVPAVPHTQFSATTDTLTASSEIVGSNPRDGRSLAGRRSLSHWQDSWSERCPVGVEREVRLRIAQAEQHQSPGIEPNELFNRLATSSGTAFPSKSAFRTRSARVWSLRETASGFSVHTWDHSATWRRSS